jgi:lysophospholipid acyltransferase (LPLAT)-like uncharacterized protein
MRLRDKLLLTLVPWLGAKLIRVLYFLQRTEVLGEAVLQDLRRNGQPLILAFWHDQLLLMIMGYRGHGAKILISPSKDGELIARTMHYFGQDAVRGSSSRGGREAFRELMSLATLDVDLVVTPDGPKGPRHQLKDGILQLARLSGRPVVPLAYVSSRGHRFQSWDRFLFPYPFARGVYSYGAPLFFSRQEPLDQCRERLSTAMAENQRRAQMRLEGYGVSAV